MWSTATNNAYFGEGLADEILNRLSAVDGLRVVARTSSFAVRASADDVRNIGQRLAVAHVLEGTVRRDGERVRIDVQLIDARRGYRSGARATTVSSATSSRCKTRSRTRSWRSCATPCRPCRRRRRSRRRRRRESAAYQLLLRGRRYLYRRDEDSLRRSILLFQRAIELDPRYGQLRRARQSLRPAADLLGGAPRRDVRPRARDVSRQASSRTPRSTSRCRSCSRSVASRAGTGSPRRLPFAAR